MANEVQILGRYNYKPIGVPTLFGGAACQSRTGDLLRKFWAFALLLMACVTPLKSAVADDVPLRVAVQGFVKPEGNELTVLLRVPMDALGEIVFPVRGTPGSLIFSEADIALETAAQVYVLSALEFYEDGRRLEDKQLRRVRVSLPSDRSFNTYDQALANIMSPKLDDSVDLYWRQGMADVLVTYPILSADSRISVDPRLAGLGVETNTVMRFVLPDGAERPFSYIGNPGLVYLDPSWIQASIRFIAMGFDHILEGTDHLLFLLCLVIPLRSVKALVPVITSFTIAHSITLIASVFGVVPSVLWFPPLIETLIALSIVYMAFENIIGFKQENRWLVTFGFGLIHGFGFSFLLTESMQFAGSHLVTALLSFNIGVELGQLLVLVLIVPLLAIVFRHLVAEKMGVIILSALVAHSAWHWMAERWSVLMSYDIRVPVINTDFYAGLAQWGILLLVAGGILWLMQALFNRFFVTGMPNQVEKSVH
ncbi:MAG: HupE/UreJ family protein [Gammaproteobacteria bacterium]|nr:HupE/UreJ family protein [Gammaproteobacteria bacterium]MDP2142224.1 HupE/UreJ family protein [Gammaproteobacteria bacterium]MDP2347873.1 HupE/UreJ family protein [Gammaproteobacteria bacterium]